MRANKRNERQREEHDHNSVYEGHSPYWKRAHRDWKFWVALSLMLAAMVIYVMSDDLALRPRGHAQPAMSGAVGR